MFREFVCAKDRIEDEFDDRLTLAWCIAVLQRHEKLPSLKDWLSKHKTRTEPKQTVSQQRAMLQALSEHIGVPLRTKKTAHGQ